MNSIKDIENNFKKSEIKDCSTLKKIWIYQNSVIVIDFSLHEIKFALDCDLEKKLIRLAFRNTETLEFFKIFLNFEDQNKIFIYANNRFNYSEISNNINLQLTFDSDIIKIVALCAQYFEIETKKNYSQFKSVVEIQKFGISQIHMDVSRRFSGKIMGMMETLDYIYINKCSLSRYGDGEYKLISSLNNSHAFQENSIKLNYELRNILANNCNGLLVAAAGPLLHDNHWNKFWINNWQNLGCYFEQNKYGDSFISRPEFFQACGKDGVAAWKRIWDAKKVCFIFGKGSRFNVDHEIFDNISEKAVIESKPTNAFSDIDKIIDEIKNKKKYDMYLIALGQTATVLSAKLHQIGFRALDIGHINASYDMIFNNGVWPERLPLKK